MKSFSSNYMKDDNKDLLSAMYLQITNDGQIFDRHQNKLTSYLSVLGGLFTGIFAIVSFVYLPLSKPFRELNLAR